MARKQQTKCERLEFWRQRIFRDRLLREWGLKLPPLWQFDFWPSTVEKAAKYLDLDMNNPDDLILLIWGLADVSFGASWEKKKGRKPGKRAKSDAELLHQYHQIKKTNPKLSDTKIAEKIGGSIYKESTRQRLIAAKKEHKQREEFFFEMKRNFEMKHDRQPYSSNYKGVKAEVEPRKPGGLLRL